MQVGVATPAVQRLELLGVLVEEATAHIGRPADLVEIDAHRIGMFDFPERGAVGLEDGQDALGETQRVLLEIVRREIDPRPADHRIGIKHRLAVAFRVGIAVDQRADLGDRVDRAGIGGAHRADDRCHRDLPCGEVLQDLLQVLHAHLVGVRISAHVDDVVRTQPHPVRRVLLHKVRLLRADHFGILAHAGGARMRQHAGDPVLQPIGPATAAAPGVDRARLDRVPAEQIAQHAGGFQLRLVDVLGIFALKDIGREHLAEHRGDDRGGVRLRDHVAHRQRIAPVRRALEQADDIVEHVIEIAHLLVDRDVLHLGIGIGQLAALAEEGRAILFRTQCIEALDELFDLVGQRIVGATERRGELAGHRGVVFRPAGRFLVNAAVVLPVAFECLGRTVAQDQRLRCIGHDRSLMFTLAGMKRLG